MTGGQEQFEPVPDEDVELERTLEDVSLPEAVAGYSKSRVALVARAAREWASALIDLGGRNNLLRYRDLRAGTLDLTNASSVAIETLLASKPVRTSALFPDPEERAHQLRRVRTIHNKAKENFEERGVETLSLACGLATWENERASGWTPCAPVLLRQASLRPLGAAQDEFELELLDEMEVNPTLLHLLKVDFDCDLPQETLFERVDGVIDELWELKETYEWLSEYASRVPGFSIEPRLVLTNFAYAKLPMVRDIENSFELLVGHDLISAIAGDEEARQAIREQGPGPDAVPRPDAIPLEDEYLVLDADSSQNYAINAVLGGTSLIVRGPPGTGKSQTIANLIASLVVRQKKVLFVAEKRAAIDAVFKRLTEKKLDELVLDLHGGAGSRRAFAERIGRALLASRSVPRVDDSARRQRVEANREQLNAYASALHEPRAPWDVSVYEMRAELIGLGEIGSDLRFSPQQLEQLSGQVVTQAENDLRDFARLGGLTLAAGESPWRRAQITTGQEAQTVLQSVEELRRTTLPNALAALRRAATETGLSAAPTVADWEPRLQLWQELADARATYADSLYQAELVPLVERLAPAHGGAFTRLRASLTSSDYKAARQELQQHLQDGVKLSDSELLSVAERATAALARWHELGGQGVPKVPAEASLEERFAELRIQIAAVEQVSRDDGLEALPTDELEQHLAALAADRQTLLKLPELHRLETGLRALPLGALLDDFEARALDEAEAVRELRGVWLTSILDSLAFADPIIGTFDADRHEATIKEYRLGDQEHLETTPARIRRLSAEHFRSVRDAHPQQDQLLLAQAKLKRRHLPVREVVRQAEDVLLALKPCWAMSPLLVSQLLPAKTMFDVVIFDEASQVTPADAIPAIVRGHQLVVAGDDRQLPPTSFFISETPESESEEEDLSEEEASALALESAGLAGTRGFESILDALNVILRMRMLLWHYRSRDERLIAFSNAHIYDRQLVTFPGVGGDRVLDFIQVPWEPGADTNSPSPEVKRVVELVLEHAATRPHESLGVIAMGIKHADRIEEHLRERLRGEGETTFADFFAEDRHERFFVKNLERVQGDERDAIILSIGYGKNANGTLPLRFGPLLVDGGERRLNVAITRAKSRLTLASSFAADDIDPTKSSAAGVQLLRQYLQYVASGAHNLGDVVLEKPPLNPFEVDVRDTLARHGLGLVPQYGVSGYVIDFVAPHPSKPGRYVLAIECDGASYHSSESARDRDRLRQSQLENLGWRFHRIWSSAWFYNKEDCVKGVLAAYEDAVKRTDDPEQARTVQPDPDPPPRPAQSGTNAAVADEVRSVFGTGNSSRRKPEGESVSSRRTARKPVLHKGVPIEDYPLRSLVALARWIESGDEIYSTEELIREMMNELGYRRLGHKIEARLRQAIKQARSEPKVPPKPTPPPPPARTSQPQTQATVWSPAAPPAAKLPPSEPTARPPTRHTDGRPLPFPRPGERLIDRHDHGQQLKDEGAQERPRFVQIPVGGYRRVAGARYHQEVIQKTRRASRDFVAMLIPEPQNPHDQNAIAVYSSDGKVGYLSREDAVTYRGVFAEVRERGYEGVACAAVFDVRTDVVSITIQLADPKRFLAELEKQ